MMIRRIHHVLQAMGKDESFHVLGDGGGSHIFKRLTLEQERRRA
jgi:hypothetical protein